MIREILTNWHIAQGPHGPELAVVGRIVRAETQRYTGEIRFAKRDKHYTAEEIDGDTGGVMEPLDADKFETVLVLAVEHKVRGYVSADGKDTVDPSNDSCTDMLKPDNEKALRARFPGAFAEYDAKTAQLKPELIAEPGEDSDADLSVLAWKGIPPTKRQDCADAGYTTVGELASATDDDVDEAKVLVSVNFPKWRQRAREHLGVQ